MAVDTKIKPDIQTAPNTRTGGVPLVTKKPAPSNLKAEQTTNPQSIGTAAHKGRIGEGNKNILKRAEEDYVRARDKLLENETNKAREQLYQMYKSLGINDSAFLATINTSLVTELSKAKREAKISPEFVSKAKEVIKELQDKMLDRGNEERKEHEEFQEKKQEEQTRKEEQQKQAEQSKAETAVVAGAAGATAAHRVTEAAANPQETTTKDGHPHRPGGVQLPENVASSHKSHSPSSHGEIKRHAFHRPRWLSRRHAKHSPTHGLISHRSDHRVFSFGRTSHEERPSLFRRSLFMLGSAVPRTTEDGEEYETEEVMHGRGRSIIGNNRNDEDYEIPESDSEESEETDMSPDGDNANQGQRSNRKARKQARELQRGDKPRIRDRIKNASRAPKKAAAKSGRAAGRVSMRFAGTAAKLAARNPYVLAAMAIVLLILVIIILFIALFYAITNDPCEQPTPSAPAAPIDAGGGEPSTEQLMATYGRTQAEVEANLVTIPFQGKEIQVHRLVQGAFEQVDREITAANTGYVVRRISGYTWRPKIGGGSGLSTHSFGITVDINDDTNPYTTADTHDIPPAYVDAFKRAGFAWGGDWQPKHDWMHFQYQGQPGAIPAGQAGPIAAPPTQGCGQPPAQAAPIEGNVPPNRNNCGGKYNLSNPLGNYGDPLCDFDKQKLGFLLQQLDPANAMKWDSIAECESTYNPNAWNAPDDASQARLDAGGAFGLFQMGSGKNGPLDHGDVNWPIQARNAIEYNKKLGGSFRYWACAR